MWSVAGKITLDREWKTDMTPDKRHIHGFSAIDWCARGKKQAQWTLGVYNKPDKYYSI
jgi:hypothetical protein